MPLTPEMTRAGLIEIRPGVFEKATNAKRIVSEAPAAGVGVDRHSGAPVEEAKDSATGSELPHTIEEELEDAGYEGPWSPAESTEDDDETGVSGMDREGRTSFRIHIALKVSNHGRRDPTGALETICDLLTDLQRRLSERLAARELDSRVSFARKRGRRNHSGKTVKFKPTLPPLF